MNSKFIFAILIVGLASLLVLSGCISDKEELKLDDSKTTEQENSTSTTVSTSNSSAVQEKMKSCSFNIANMKFQYFAVKDKVYMKTLDTEDSAYTEQVITKTETCAKTVDGVKGCYPNTEEDFQVVYDEALTGSCTEVDYNGAIFEIK